MTDTTKLSGTLPKEDALNGIDPELGARLLGRDRAAAYLVVQVRPQKLARNLVTTGQEVTLGITAVEVLDELTGVDALEHARDKRGAPSAPTLLDEGGSS